jgi:ribonuclease HI
MKTQLHLFTDGSVNTQSKIGFGASLCIEKLTLSPSSLNERVQVKRFEETSSTKLELQTLIWAVEALIGRLDSQEIELTVYTDSQNIISLPERRRRLESDNYISRNNKQLPDQELYREFYNLLDTIFIDLVKVKGHQPTSQRDSTSQLFKLVDQASRRALRLDRP